ncbi:MAG: MarR family winged helix-turn-helix transcriptional regulator [Nocardioides sp.]
MSRADSLRDLEQEVGVMIRRIRRVIWERARAVHPELMPTSYLVLTLLAQNGAMRPSAVAEKFDIDKGAISRQVQHLCQLGLLVRVPDPDDGRASLISASDDALRRLADVDDRRRKWLGERLGEWSAADLRDFVAGLTRYNRALDSLPK